MDRCRVTIARWTGSPTSSIGLISAALTSSATPWGGVIALELARSNPEVVRSLVLIEPPLPLVGLGEGPPPQFLVDGVELWQEGDHEAATDVFFRTIASPTWRADIAHASPQGLEQVSQNAHLFF